MGDGNYRIYACCMPVQQNLTSRCLFIAILCLLSFFFSVAQTSHSPSAVSGIIKGIIIDSIHQEVISNVTIIIQEAGKEKLIKHTISNENGSFKVKGLPIKHYQATFSCIGYRTKTIILPAFTAAITDLRKIELAASPVPLKEVQVLAKQPLIEQDPEKIIYHVDQDPEKEILTALDMFRKTPLLTLDAGGNLQMNGSSNYQILINGKRSSLFEFNSTDIFRSMRASAIKSIEVITTPPSRYDADGIGGIINIITHKKNITGYNGSVNISGESPFAYNISSYGMVKTGRAGFNMQLAANSQNPPENIYHFFREDKYRKSKLHQKGESKNNSRFQYINGEVRYDLNAFEEITINYNINKSDGTGYFKQQVALSDSVNTITSAYQRSNASTTMGNGFEFGLHYQKSFKKSNKQLLTFFYTLSNSTNTSEADYTLDPLLNYSNQASNTNYNDGTREHSFQIDYVQPLQQQSLEMGFKSVFRNNSSEYTYSNLDTASGTFIQDAAASNNFNYQQNVHAIYTMYNWKKGNWALKSGARIEQTTIDAHFKSTAAIVSRNYINFIPNLILSRKIKGAQTLRLSYTQRLERPGLFYINPYIDLTDPRNITYGNPKLRPAIGHLFNLAYNVLIKQSFVNISLLHTFTNNSIQQFTFLTDSVAHTTFGNIGRHQSSSISINGNTRLFKELTANINISARHLMYTSMINNKLNLNKGFTFNLFSSFSYQLKNDWTINGDFSYSSANITIQGKTAGFIKNSFGVNKQFLKDKKAMISTSVINLFPSKRHSYTETNAPAFYQLQESWLLIRRFVLSFNYRFGKVQK
jgi:hypothetical protein